MKEQWLNIKSFDGYQVSNLGRVRTHNKVTSSKKFAHRKWKDRVLAFKGVSTPSCRKTGHRVDLWKEGKPHTLLVARITAFTFFDKDINDHTLTVNHKDGNRLNNNISNLELISLADNIRHGFETGLYSNQKKVRLIDENDTCREFRSLSEASRYLGRNVSYVSSGIKRGKKLFRDAYGKSFRYEED